MSPNLRAKVYYTRTGFSKYISHLDVIDIISKALRKTGVPYETTTGCHIRPKISFSSALPLGHASLCEFFVIKLIEPDTAEQLICNMNLPEGMQVVAMEYLPNDVTSSVNVGEKVTYNLYFNDHAAFETSLKYLTDKDQTVLIKKKGVTKTFLLSSAIENIDFNEKDLILNIVFIQGVKDKPSASKIIISLADYLGSAKDSLTLIERVLVESLG